MYNGEVISGTFTPTVVFGSGSVGMTFNYRYGFYQKIGPMVDIFVAFSLSNAGSSTGDMQITNAPYSFNGNMATNAFFSGLVSIPSGNYIVVIGNDSNTSISIGYSNSVAALVLLGNPNCSSGSIISFNMSYITTS